jgi:FtsP/CotA-like multicopper oxidase with cupredoxin domain
MNRLFQLLRKLLIAALAGVLISIGTFPGEVTALTLAQVESHPNKLPSPDDIDDFLPIGTGRSRLLANDETCPSGQEQNFQNPPFLSSSGAPGRLSITLTAAEDSFQLGDSTFSGTLYNQSYTPPTLRVNPSDAINLTLQNYLSTLEASTNQPQDTNFHYHGFNVSPNQGSDDVLFHVRSHYNSDYQYFDGSYQMHVQIPDNHSSGLYWYHPHHHGTSNFQVKRGMSGGIIVEGIENYYSIINGIPLKDSQQPTPKLTERVMLFKDLQLKDTNKKQFNCFTLNGLIKPKMTIQPGEVQFWRIGNIGADIYLNLALQDASSPPQNLQFYVLARDGNIVTKPMPVTNFVLPPASRVEVLVFADDKVTEPYNLVSLPYGKPSEPANYNLANVAVQGDSVKYDTGSEDVPTYITNQTPKSPGITPLLPTIDDLVKEDIPADNNDCDTNHISDKCTRTFEFDNPEKGKFTINGKQYDENRIDTTVTVGDTEDWFLVNKTNAPHAFHIHQLDFLDMTNYDPTKPQGYQDTIDLPPCTKDDKGICNPSTTKVRIPFTDPLIAGEFVYHCHILAHEDAGMMQNIQVNPKS